jgi:hypothetical protein
MADVKLLKQYLPENLIEYASLFDIPEDFLEADPELIQLILESKALDTDEDKQNWFNLLPLMTEDQIIKLREILLKEKKKLEEIEAKYEKKKREIRQKYLLRWQKLGYMDKIKEIQEKEQAIKSKEEEEAEKLLDML